jgi:phenylalanyl-tRNA synthetase beta chain
MKVSVNWVKQYADFELPPTVKLVEKIGAQLGAVEEVIDLGAQYQGILIVKVVECQKLEGSDHLNICKIDDGGKAESVERDDKGLVQVVCGAPNVTAGIFVAWLPPGSTVPSSYGAEPFVLEARELRGAKSNGMLASPKELAIGDSHEGLLILDGDLKPGDDFAKTYELNDTIIDIENKMFTHRPDCFGQLGVAREIAGILGQPFTSPDWYSTGVKIESSGEKTLKVEVKNELPNLAPRFTAIPLSNITVGSSPIWLQTYLQRVGIRPINNVVDLTNYYMMLSAQPLHAYDYDKLIAQDGADHATLTIRHPQKGEKLKLLNGKEIEPRKEAILIASATKPIGLAGVMGGADTEVDANTKNIVLECASFDMYSIRRSSMAHGLFSEATTRFNKGQSPLQNLAVLAKITDNMVKIVGAKVAGDAVDDNHVTAAVVEVPVAADFINARLGLKLTADEMAKLLTNVEFAVKTEGDQLTVTAPFWRTDIEIPEDIVEEVGRLYGFDHLVVELPQRSLKPAAKNDMLELRSKVRQSLAKAGANETLNYSFVPGSLIEKVGQNKDLAFQISNALSPDLQYYRLDMLPSLLEKVHPNSKAGYDEFALFEMGKSHTMLHKDDGEDGLPLEIEMLALVYAGNDKKIQKPGAAYYEARQFLQQLATDLGIQLEFSVPQDVPDVPVVKFYEPGRSAYVTVANSDIFLGMVGEFNATTRKNLKLPEHSAGFEVGLLGLLAAQNSVQPYTALPRFPKVEQDICLRVAADLTYGELYTFVQEELAKIQPAETLPSLTPVDIYQRPDDLEHKQITFRLSIASYQKTMTDTEVGALLDTIAAAAHQKYNADRI